MGYRFEITEGHIVRTTHIIEGNECEIWNIYLENIFWGGRIAFPMPVEPGYKDRLLWIRELTDLEFAQTGEFRAKGPNKGILCIYSNRNAGEMYFIMYTTYAQLYRHFIRCKHRRERAALTKDNFRLEFEYCFHTEKGQDLDATEAILVIDQNHQYRIEPKLTAKKIFQKTEITIPLESIISQETPINNPIHVELNVHGETLEYNIGHKKKKSKKKPVKFNYVPITEMYFRNKALAVRKNVNQNYTLVVRDRETIEYDPDFLKNESKWNSFYRYHWGKMRRKFHKKPVNLYFEKDSMKAEEGTWEIFCGALQKSTSENYFILDPASPQWERLSREKNVIAKYSKDYYKLLYSADCFISTETSSHLNVHRAINPYIRRTLLEKKFIFLQHGITYLKCQGAGSVFGKGKEGEPDYIAVSSKKEAEAVCRMLHIPEERCMMTGLPIFGTIKYGHINETSDDIITIMMTWRPSEEHLIGHFENSIYYEKVREVYGLLVRKFPEKEIHIVPHPKVFRLLMETDFAERIWQGNVADALAATKLLITDYSSVCYNAFYQGAAVIFYQPDLEAFEQEVGRLVPEENEYIGFRVFGKKEMERLIDRVCRGGKLDYRTVRTPEFERRYEQINSFHDGKNIDRVLCFLKEKAII